MASTSCLSSTSLRITRRSVNATSFLRRGVTCTPTHSAWLLTTSYPRRSITITSSCSPTAKATRTTYRSGSLLLESKLHTSATTKMSTSQGNQEKKDWSATQYLKFEAERTRPARDLLAQVPSTLQPKRIIDLGCGPGNSTAVLKEKFPNAHLSGMDSSPDMIEKAKKRLPDIDFHVADLLTYEPPTGEDESDVDLYFSNAVFQWLDGGDRLAVIKRLMQTQKPGAVFAWQVPDNFNEYSHAAMRETAALDGAPWKEVFAAGKNPARELMESPRQLYDELKPLCSSITIWHTYYQVIMDNHEGIVEWVKGTGLQPFLNPLNEEQREGFLREYLARLKRSYPTQYDGKVLLRYPRLFVVTVR